MMDNQFAKLPAIVPLSRGRHVSRGASSRHVTLCSGGEVEANVYLASAPRPAPASGRRLA